MPLYSPLMTFSLPRTTMNPPPRVRMRTSAGGIFVSTIRFYSLEDQYAETLAALVDRAMVPTPIGATQSWITAAKTKRPTDMKIGKTVTMFRTEVGLTPTVSLGSPFSSSLKLYLISQDRNSKGWMSSILCSKFAKWFSFVRTVPE